jgi:hypothetical protein
MGLKQELASPFQVANQREWNDVYVILQGTQLSLYRLKSASLLSKNRAQGPGKLIRNYSLQHAEIGIAADFKKTHLVPKSPFAHLVPASARQKLFETDPHLFEPIREYAIRLRLETEQFLLCAATQEEMLDWVEALCAALDISTPLEDRSEPRYRSLPRRSRRQRILDGATRVANLDDLASMDIGRRIIAEQERIIRQLYPHLAEGNVPEHTSETAGHATAAQPAVDPETDDLDPEDARFPSARRTTSHGDESEDRPSSSATSDSSADPKSRPPHRHSPSQALRYRKRCAPVLLASSPRVSDVVFIGGKRMRINVKEHMLVEYTGHPPRYDAHKFVKAKKSLAPIVEIAVPRIVPSPINTERPSSPVRGISDDSFTSFGYDLASTSSDRTGAAPADDSDDIRSAPSSEPPSPTAATQAKADAARKLVSLSKTRSSEERVPEDGLSAVALGVGLLI